LREVEKYPTIVGFEPGTLELIAIVLTNFAERADKHTKRLEKDRDQVKTGRRSGRGRDAGKR